MADDIIQRVIITATGGDETAAELKKVGDAAATATQTTANSMGAAAEQLTSVSAAAERAGVS